MHIYAWINVFLQFWMGLQSDYELEEAEKSVVNQRIFKRLLRRKLTDGVEVTKPDLVAA